MFQNIGFIGLGLIGGSIARAVKEKSRETQIIAYDADRSTLQYAHTEGIVDIACSSINSNFKDCEIIFLCAPVSANADNLNTLANVLSPGTLLTDVGSVKGDIHKHIEALGLSTQFIGGHPMAGSERIGYVNSKARLLENAYFILTPTSTVSQDMINRYQNFILEIGSLPIIMSCEEHDYYTAGISHLPHIISASLVNLVKHCDNEDGTMKMIAAGGFKDITRISSSSPVMWEHICMTNSSPILELLDQYVDSLKDIKQQIIAKNNSKVYDFFDEARQYRESFANSSSGPIKRSYEIFVDIPDEPGALATIATLLAFRQINIKNIGITHNREIAEGALRIELSEESDISKAISVLKAKGYVVQIR